MSNRKQFTFYRSFWDAAQMLKTPEAKTELFEAVCRFALDGVEPAEMSGEAGIAYVLIKPTLETGRRKAIGASGKAADENGENRTNGGMAF